MFNFEESLERHIPDVKNIIGAELSYESPEDREDLVQDILFRLLRYKGSFDKSYNFKVDIDTAFHRYIVNTTYNCIRTYYNNKKKNRKYMQQYCEKQDYNLDPERELEAKETLENLINSLSDDELDVYWNHYVMTREVPDIATALGCSVAKIYQLLSDIRSKL